MELQEEMRSEQKTTVERSQDEMQGFKMLIGDALKGISSDVPFINISTNSEIDKNSPKLVILPGLEGTETAIKPLASNLIAQNICIQYNNLKQANTVKEMALAYLPVRKKNLTVDLILIIITI